MTFRFKSKLWQQFLLSIILLIVFILSLISITVYYRLKASIEKESQAKLTAIRNVKREQVETYFDNLCTQTELIGTYKNLVDAYKISQVAYGQLAQNVHVYASSENQIRAKRDSIWKNKYALKSKIEVKKTDTMLPQNLEACILQLHAWDSKNLKDNGPLRMYDQINEDVGVKLKTYAEKVGFHDILFVDSKSGNIVYTVAKESDLGANVYKNPFSKSGIRKAFDAMKHTNTPSTYIQDFAAYAPSHYMQSGFISAPIIENGENIGVIICQINLNALDKICTFSKDWRNQGMGQTGEVYLLGSNGSMRSESRFLYQDKNALLKQLEAQGIYKSKNIDYIRNYNTCINSIHIHSNFAKQILAGKEGIAFSNDYRDVPSIGAFSPIKIQNLQWGIVAKFDQDEAYSEIRALRIFLALTFIILLVVGVTLSIIISKRITKPINHLRDHAIALSNGDYSVDISLKRNDEIGELAQSFQQMKSKIVLLIQDLTITNNDLEIKRKDLIDSISYAQKIQENIFPTKELVNKYIPNSFLFFQPRDIVSGDFYWAIEHENEMFLAVCDSTGHGIPGAFMSMLNVSFLNEAVLYENLKEPGDIFNRVRQLLIEVFKSERQDGMDGTLLRYNPEKHILHYAAANNPLILVRNNSYEILEYDKMPIGQSLKNDSFKTYSIEIQKGDNLFIITDGFADQFGGLKNKKYKYKPLFEFLTQHASLSSENQRISLIEEFTVWQQDNEQVDDVTILGIKF